MRRQGIAPRLVLGVNRLAGVGGLGGEDVEVAVLAGFGEGVGFFAGADVVGHAEEEVGDGDLVVC